MPKMIKLKKRFKLSEPHNRVLEWLNDPDADFQTGYALLARFSRNRAMLLYLGRKQDLSKLRYELEKMMSTPITEHGFKHVAPISRVMTTKEIIAELSDDDATGDSGNGDPDKTDPPAEPGQKDPDKTDPPAEPGNDTGKAPDKTDPPAEPGQKDPDKTDPPAETGKEGEKDPGVWSPMMVISGGKVDYEQLTDDLKKVYDANVEDYKTQRTLHEKMKLATTDEERAQLRAEIVKLDDQIHAGWKAIDDFVLNRQEKKPEPDQQKSDPKPLDPAESSKAISSARTYISRNLPKVGSMQGTEREQLVEKIKERVKVMSDNNANLSEETTAELKKQGII